MEGSRGSVRPTGIISRGIPSRFRSRIPGWILGAGLGAALTLVSWAVTPGMLAAQDPDLEDEERDRCVCVNVDERVDVERIRERVRRSLQEVERARRRLDRMEEMPADFGGRARLGIEIRPEQPGDADVLGVRVAGVGPESPASDAGLREGDVIVGVGGQRLAEPLDDTDVEDALDPDLSLPVQRLTTILAEQEPGDRIQLVYSRDGQEQTVEVELGAFDDLPGLRGVRRFGRGDAGPGIRRFRIPEPPRVPEVAWRRGFGPGLSGPGSGSVAGLRVETLGPELGAYFGTDEGVLILDVEEDSPLGLEPGDVVLSIGDREIDDAGDFHRVLRSYEEGEEVGFRVRRDNEEVAVEGMAP